MPSPLATLTLFARDSRIVAAQEQGSATQPQAPAAESKTAVTQSQAPAEQLPSDTGQKKPGGISPLFLFAMLGLAFWMIVMRPGRRDKQDRQKKLDAIKKGDRVVSIGGIHGKVSEVDHAGGVVTVEVAPKVPVKFSKAAIQTVDSRGGDKPEAKTGE